MSLVLKFIFNFQISVRIMLQEVSAAVLFIASILKRSQKVSNEVICKFVVQLYEDLGARFKDHWFENYPERGSAYRCIRNTSRKGLDPRICKAGSSCGLSKSDLTAILPTEFILWIDPHEVSYRVGEYGCLTKLSREEMAKAHNTLKGANACFTPRTATSSPAKGTSRSSPITIRSVEDLQKGVPALILSDDGKLLGGTPKKGSSSLSSSSQDIELEHSSNLKNELEDHRSESSVSLTESASEGEMSATTSQPADNILDFVEENSTSLTTSIFEQSMGLFDFSNRDHLFNTPNEFDQAYRFTDAMNSGSMHWNNMNPLTLLAGNFWQQSQSGAAAAAGFNDYLASQAFNSTANSAIYALN